MKRFAFMLIAAAFIVTVNSKDIYAAGFDFNYYAQRYPDIANTVGYNEDALYKHYQTIGQKEGRYANAEEECAATAKTIEKQNAIANGTLPVAAAEETQTPAAAATPVLNTFVDVDIANQTVTLFQNSIPVLSTPCVTGTPKNGRSTPTGVWYILEHKPGKRLVGPTWDVWVDRWMKFTPDSCGLHDASWRKKFGGNIYLSNGSHGCVNLPKDVAYVLYDLVDVGTPVVVH